MLGMKVWEKLLLMKGINLIVKMIKNLIIRSLAGYDTKIGPHTGSDVAQVAEDYHPLDADYWKKYCPNLTWMMPLQIQTLLLKR